MIVCNIVEVWSSDQKTPKKCPKINPGRRLSPAPTWRSTCPRRGKCRASTCWHFSSPTLSSGPSSSLGGRDGPFSRAFTFHSSPLPPLVSDAIHKLFKQMKQNKSITTAWELCNLVEMYTVQRPAIPGLVLRYWCLGWYWYWY